MGAAYAGTCYASDADARAAHCVGSYPVAGLDGSGQLVTYTCEGTTAGGLLIVRSDPVAGAASAVELASSYVECSGSSLNAVPTAETLGAAWAFGFGGVVTLYLIAWGAGRVLDMISSK